MVATRTRSTAVRSLREEERCRWRTREGETERESEMESEMERETKSERVDENVRVRASVSGRKEEGGSGGEWGMTSANMRKKTCSNAEGGLATERQGPIAMMTFA